MFSPGPLSELAAVMGSRSEVFFARLFELHPELFDRVEGLHLLDALQSHLEPTSTQAWIETLRRRGSEWHAQATAELLVLRLWRLEDDGWARQELAAIFAAKPPFSPDIIASRAGMALMIGDLMPDIPSKSPLFDWLLALASTPAPAVTVALRQTAWALMFDDCDCNDMGDALLRFLAENPTHVDGRSAGNIIRMMVRYVNRSPVLVAAVARTVLEQTRGSFMEHDDLLGVIVAIHESEDLREQGLDLFEYACDLDMSGTAALLDEHNDLLERKRQAPPKRPPRRTVRRRSRH